MPVPPHLSPADQAAVLATYLDHPEFCRRTLTIRDKEKGQDVPLVLTPAQIKLTEAINKQRKRGLPVRVRVLKARQVHMSVGCASHIWKAVSFLPGQQGKVYAHLNEATRNLYKYYKQFDEGYRTLAGLSKLELTKGSRINQTLAYTGGGGLEFGSAETSRGGRSASFKFLHLSETAFWQRADELRTGLLASVPDLADTMILDESTANGMGGAFYRGWMDAMDTSNDNGWLAVFFAWWEHPEYVARIADERWFQESLTNQERDMALRYGLTIYQLAWRRWAIANKCEGDERRFLQEFPSNPEEAFLTSGRPVFDMGAIARQPASKPSITGELVEERIGPKTQIMVEPSGDDRGLLRVWRKPEPNQRYVIGLDACKGIDANSGTGSADPDYAVAHVLEADSGEQVAMMRGRIEPAEFGRQVWALMRFYNYAFCVPDADSFGVAVIEELLRQQVPGELLYRRKRDASDQQSTPLQYLGFITTVTSKPQVISDLQMALRQRAITVRDPITLAELRSFVFKPNGTTAAEEGAHDDTVMALALAVLAIKESYLLRREREAMAKSYDQQPRRYR
jgi:hypothetical protein